MTQDNQLEAWLAQERGTQARLDAGVGPGVVRAEQMAGRSGLEMMRAMLRGEVPYPPIAKTLDFDMSRLRDALERSCTSCRFHQYACFCRPGPHGQAA